MARPAVFPQWGREKFERAHWRSDLRVLARSCLCQGTLYRNGRAQMKPFNDKLNYVNQKICYFINTLKAVIEICVLPFFSTSNT